MDEQQARRLLARLSGRRATRVIGAWKKGTPSRWHPGQVIDPTCGMPYTDDGAWKLIADLLLAGHPIDEVILEKPPGRKAYVLLVELDPNEPLLYIKLQLGSGVVIGRSFHYSEDQSEREES